MDEVYFRAYDGSRSLWSTVLNIGAFPVTRDWIFGDEITRDHQQRNMPMVLQNSGLYRTTSSYLVVYLVPGVAQPGLLPRYFESIVTERYVTLSVDAGLVIVCGVLHFRSITWSPGTR